jgi:hypothetical protein
MELNLNELTLISFNLTEFIAVNNLVAMEHNTNPQFSKVHLITLNLNNFKMTEAIRSKLLHRGPLEWHYLRTKFHENLQNGSKVISGGHTDTHTHTQTYW